jgi:hypothetical protein
MFPRPTTLCRFAVLGVVLCNALARGAEGLGRSPFLPPQASGPAAPTQGAPLEYVGYLTTSEGVRYRIYNPATKAAAWVKLNERNPDMDIVVKQHNDDAKTLTIEHGGRTITLAERKAKVVSGGAPTMPAPPAPAPVAAPANVAPAVTQSVVLNPTPADEQRRLEAVAAEVARRRALREQATQQMSTGQPPTPGQPRTPPANFQQQPQNAPQRR